MKCVKHPDIDAVEPFLIFNNGGAIPLCKNDIIEIKTRINFKFVDAVGSKRITDEIKRMDKVDEQKTLRYTIDIIKTDETGKTLDAFLQEANPR